MTSTEASTLMQQGIARLDMDTPESLTEAIACFDAAIDLRRQLFTPGDHGAAYLLAASWMNRGDALTRLRGPNRLAEAVRSYDEALEVLQAASPDVDPLYRRRHAIAWMNRGLTLQEQDTPGSLEEAIGSFARAIAVTQDQPEHALLLAGVLINHAKALLSVRPAHAAAARRSAQLALEQTSEIELKAPLAAEIHLKAQILLCRAAETLLDRSPAPEESRELLCAATDAVETGLALARRWEERGETCLGSLPTILFRFGIDLYCRRQPQFLGEFIRENLQASVSLEWHRLAVETLTAETLAAGRASFAYLNTPHHEFVLENIETLRFTRQRIRELTQTPAAEVS